MQIALKIALNIVAFGVFLSGALTVVSAPLSGAIIILSSFFIAPLGFASKILRGRKKGNLYVSNRIVTPIKIILPLVLFIIGVSFFPPELQKPHTHNITAAIPETFIATTESKMEENTPSFKEVPQTILVEPVKVVQTSPSLLLSSRISAFASEPYEKKHHPKTFAKYGARIKDVEKARRAAAYVALSSGNCDQVITADPKLLDGTKENLQIWVLCNTNQDKYQNRFDFEEADLKDLNGKFYTEDTVKDANKVKTSIQRALPKEEALKLCRKMILDFATFPSSIQISMLGQRGDTVRDTGETWVNVDFSGKNQLGETLSQQAYCSFPINSAPKFKVEAR